MLTGCFKHRTKKKKGQRDGDAKRRGGLRGVSKRTKKKERGRRDSNTKLSIVVFMFGLVLKDVVIVIVVVADVIGNGVRGDCLVVLLGEPTNYKTKKKRVVASKIKLKKKSRDGNKKFKTRVLMFRFAT